MKDLNGHYCLATPLHYEQLVKDGYEYKGIKAFLNGCGGYISIVDNVAIEWTEPAPRTAPMHYHNGQWVFSSLEHEEKKACGTCGEYMDKARCDCTDIPKRITREEAIQKYDDGNYTSSELLDPIFNYIEYLEANQKDK